MKILCPECGQPSVPLLYGKPTPEAVEEARRGEIALAGCAAQVDSPDRTCGTHRFHEKPSRALGLRSFFARALR